MSQAETWILKNESDMPYLINLCQENNITYEILDKHHLYVSNHIDTDKIDIVKNECSQHNYIKTRDLSERTNNSFTPVELGKIYNFPQGDGTGQKIGIISLGGGYTMSDINTYLQHLNLPINPDITNVTVNGAFNNPNHAASLEVVLDLEIVLAIVPKASIRMYFAPNSFSGFYNAILAAINDQCNIVSISWGLYESGYGLSNLTAYNNLFKQGADQGVAFFVAAGDNGSSDGSNLNNALNVDFPSSSQYVVGCGGTTLTASNNVRTSEVVWNNNPYSSATGGGVSKYFSKPSFQNNVAYPLTNRGVSDISCNADPYTGYRIYYRGAYTTVGGTSASAPLMAGLFARINQITGQNVGFVNPLLYQHNIYYDVISGNNGAYNASIHWDPASGCGVIDGQSLLNLFSTQTTPIAPIASFTSMKTGLVVNFTNTSTNATSYLWDFGDSNTSTLTNPSHTYLPGVYTVILTAIKENQTNSYTQELSFLNDFTASPMSGIAPLTVTFNTGASSHIWDFGDNQTSTVQNPIHVYQAGIYNVTLTTDTNTIVKTINVTSGFLADFTFVIVKNRVRFTNTSTGNPIRYTWQFGNGVTSPIKNPMTTYNRKGVYSVRLTVYKGNLVNTIVKQITI